MYAVVKSEDWIKMRFPQFCPSLNFDHNMYNYCDSVYCHSTKMVESGLGQIFNIVDNKDQLMLVEIKDNKYGIIN